MSISLYRYIKCQRLASLVVSIVMGMAYGAAWADSTIYSANWKVRSDRVAAAKWLLRDVTTLLDSIPTPRPKDIEWVESEQVAIKGSKDSSTRISALVRSLEYQHINVREGLGNLAGWLKCAIDARSLKSEAVCWAGATLVMSDIDVFNYGLTKLVDAGLAANSFQGGAIDRDRGIAPNMSFMAKSIHANFTMSYLKGELTN